MKLLLGLGIALGLLVGGFVLLRARPAPGEPGDPAAVVARHRAAGTAGGGSVDLSAWDRLLRRHVRRGSLRGIELNVLDYEAVRQDADFAATLKALASAELGSLGRDAALALWIDAYNALAVKVVLDHWPLESIRDAGGKLLNKVWDQPAGTVAGKVWTLNQIEHEILRKLDEPRIHAAIVCASVSCPDLLPEAYSGKPLDAQLARATSGWLANAGKGMRLDAAARELHLSAIFDWFREDFTRSGSVVDFVRRHAPPAQRALLEQQGEGLEVRYLDYDWTLNGKALAQPAAP